MASLAKKQKEADPFYYQITPTTQEFTNDFGSPESVDLPLITLPPGTVLFRGMKVPNPANVDVRTFYRDYLGDPEGSSIVCMRPTTNVFFYPFPYIAFGANQVGETFDMMQMVVLVHPMTVVSSVAPSQWVRGTAQAYSGSAPYKRCDSFPLSCHPLSAKEKDALSYDNCLSPEYQVRSGTRGWMALADLDAFNPKRKTPTESTMSTYMRELEKRMPGKASELTAWSYTDASKHHGFPEIALYPYKTHQGSKLLKRTCKSHEDAVRWMAKEAKDDNLNFLPIATFTAKGTVDMVQGLFTYESLGISANNFSAPSSDKQPEIERRIAEYMDMLQTKGIDLPTFGNDKMKLDTRTGFYVLPQVIPRSLRVPLPEGKTQPYSFLAIPLNTEEAKKRAMTYILMFRNFIPDKFMDKYGIDKGFGLPRAMVFDRPPVMARVFDEIGIDVPEHFKDGIRRAAALHQKEGGKKKELPASTKYAGTSVPGGPTTPAYMSYGAVPGGPTTPPFDDMTYGAVPGGPTTPPFDDMSYGAVPGGPTTPPFGSVGPTTPPLEPTRPNSPAMVNAIKKLRQGVPLEEIILGGYGAKPLTEEEKRRLRDIPPSSPKYVPGSGPVTPLTGGTRRVKKGTRSTRGTRGRRGTSRVKKSLEDVAKLFSKVWKKV
jgi:hypothetical protein